ncbi:hypothetical protein KW785_03640 [Candidatus Parcubacteria bacterium]|nr:hypothetical protein [Candidatus Parcubacteria bacterium]
MSIQDTFEIDKGGEVVRRQALKRFFLSLVVVLVALLAFGLGRLSGQGRVSGVEIKFDQSLLEGDNTATALSSVPSVSKEVLHTGQVFASSKGTRYYYEGCKSTVSEKNKVFFESASMAEKAGYTLAANCHQ